MRTIYHPPCFVGGVAVDAVMVLLAVGGSGGRWRDRQHPTPHKRSGIKFMFISKLNKVSLAVVATTRSRHRHLDGSAGIKGGAQLVLPAPVPAGATR